MHYPLPWFPLRGRLKTETACVLHTPYIRTEGFKRATACLINLLNIPIKNT